MADSVYQFMELVGTSERSWEEAARNAVEKVGRTYRDIRVAEVVMLDLKVEAGRVLAYRARVKVSYKYEG